MPAYRFSWEAFDEDTVRSLAGALGCPAGTNTLEECRAYLGSRVPRPRPEFVRDCKEILLRTWLPQYAGLKGIVDQLIEAGVGPMRVPNSARGYLEYVKKTRNTKTLQTVISRAMARFGDQDRRQPEDDDGGEFVKGFSILKPREQRVDGRKPHEYQEEAWQRLDKEFALSQSIHTFEGLLVMPTGSGKTYTAVTWLLKNVINQRMRVLWLAHTHELLTQAAAEFQALCGMVRPLDKLVRIRVVSSVYCAATQIDPADDVVVASIASLARRPDITENWLRADSKRFVVIDEAHRAPAKSYKDLIERLKKRKPYHLLGITATPTRTLEIERPVLTGLFGGKTISQVTIRTLIEENVLARPHLVTVKTDADVEQGVTRDELRYYERFGEPSETWLDRIAHMSNRNEVIVGHYLDHRERYGPTLIFAINVLHAALLTERLKQAGVSAEYVASYRPDNTQGLPSEIIDGFREGRLDVLVNVQMMTEGVDVPAIQTVMLTRPTSSEILVRQMIGRALRGKKMGGTDKAYLVSFEDHWKQFRDWESPFDLVPDIVKESVLEGGIKTPPEVIDISEVIPWSLIREVAGVLASQPTGEVGVFEAIPHGWYILGNGNDHEGTSKIVPVYEHQRVCWEALIDHLKDQRPGTVDMDRSDFGYEEFFSDCDYPWPSKHDVALVINQFAAGGTFPEYRDFEERRQCDPHQVAREIRDGAFPPPDTKRLIEERYTDLARAIYSDLRAYRRAIDDAIYDLDYPEESKRPKRAIPVFQPRSDEQLTPGPAHDLDNLMRDMLNEGKRILGLAGELPYSGQGCVTWTRRLVKGWYGIAYVEPTEPQGFGIIKINRLLDSPDVTADTLRFLLWHEYLHLYLKQAHTAAFREWERKWLGVVDAERFLDNLNERFGVQYW